MVLLDTNIFVYIAKGRLPPTIALRQRHPMSLGDAVIAATALEHQVELWTASADDFRRIDELCVANPLSSKKGSGGDTFRQN